MLLIKDFFESLIRNIFKFYFIASLSVLCFPMHYKFVFKSYLRMGQIMLDATTVCIEHGLSGSLPRAQRGRPGSRRSRRPRDVVPSREKAKRQVNEVPQAFAEDPSRGFILN